MKISLFLEGVKKAGRKPEGVNGDTKTINMDDPLPDVGNELAIRWQLGRLRGKYFR